MGDQRSVSNVFIKLFCGTLWVVSMHLVLLFKVHVNGHCCTWACVCLKCLHLCSAVGWLCVSLGWRDSSPLLKYRGFVNNSRENFGGRGIAGLPSSSQLQRVHLRRRCVLWRRKDCTQAFLFTTEEEGKAFFLTNEEQVLLLTMWVCNAARASFCLEQCQLRGESLGCECACVGEQRKLVRWSPRRTWKRTLQVQVGVKQSRSGPGFILHVDDF